MSDVNLILEMYILYIYSILFWEVYLNSLRAMENIYENYFERILLSWRNYIIMYLFWRIFLCYNLYGGYLYFYYWRLRESWAAVQIIVST